MSRLPGIPRIALTWLLVAQVLVIVPHLVHLPMWMIALWLGAASWRVQIFRMRARYPGGWVKGGLVLLVLIGILFSRGTLVGLDAAVVLLIATFILKLLETGDHEVLLPVVSKLLALSPEETQRVKKAYVDGTNRQASDPLDLATKAATDVTSYLSGWVFSSKK